MIKKKYNLCIDVDEKTLMNPPDNRVYYCFFEEKPNIKMQVTGVLLKHTYKTTIEHIMKRLSREIENEKI